MSAHAPRRSGRSLDPRRAAAPALMALSGAASLAYETVWLRQLARAFGATVYAIAGLVALYMGGLALGAAWASRSRRAGDWLRRYAWLELGAGLASLAATWWLLRLPAVAAVLSGDSPLSSAARLALAAPALLPPTILLGATLPVLARDGGDAAFLYGANTLGALVGLLIAAFWTIGSYGETATVAWAAGANAAAAAAAFLLSRGKIVKPAGPPPGTGAAPRLALTLSAASGFCALGCEVLWSRQLIPLLGNSTYAFALILAAYLLGLGLGSSTRVETPRPWEAFAQLLAALGAAIALSAAADRFIGLRLDSPDFLYSPLTRWSDFPLIAGAAVALVLPVALILGLLFPVALRLAGDEGGRVGRLYAWNTVGGILGSLLCGFAVIPRIGAHAGLLALAALACAAGLIAARRAGGRAAWAGAAAGAALAAAALAYAPRDPAVEVLLHRLNRAGEGDVSVGFHDESAAATIVGTNSGRGPALFINGIATSARGTPGVLMEILPNLAVPNPRAALVICFGAGNTFRTASLLGSAVDAVELIADVPRRMAFFQPDAAAILAKPGNAVHVEDGRNYLLRSKRLYDTIVIDATPPLFSAGAVNLYTAEFFALARRRLTLDGVFALWLPLPSFESDYWQILSAADASFEHVAVWAWPNMPGFLVLGSAKPLTWSPEEMERRYRARIGAAAANWPDFKPGALARGFWLKEEDQRAYAARYAPLTDDRPTVEFPLPRFWRGEPQVQSTQFLSKASAPR